MAAANGKLAYPRKGGEHWDNSLLRRVLDELDTLDNVALEAGVASLEKLLLVFVGAWDDVDGLFCSLGLFEIC